MRSPTDIYVPPDTKTYVKTIIDTAREIAAGGETVHQIIGEISISLERLLKLTAKQIIKHPYGKTEEIQSVLDEKYLREHLINRFFKETEARLKQIYENQQKERDVRKWAPFRWALAGFLFVPMTILAQIFFHYFKILPLY